MVPGTVRVEDHEAVVVLVGHLVQASLVHLVVARPHPAVVVQDQGSGPVVGHRVVGGEMEEVGSVHWTHVGVLDRDVELVGMAWMGLVGEG